MQNQFMPYGQSVGVAPQYYPQQQPTRTVWTDLDTERADMTTAERTHVEQDGEYRQADYDLQTAFQGFLQSKFRDEFLTFDTRGLAEKKLLALKVARKSYHAANDGIMDDPEVKALIEKKRGERSGN